MELEDIERAYDLHMYMEGDGCDIYDHAGWSKAIITGFEIDVDKWNIVMTVQHSWGEEISFSFDIGGSDFMDFCDRYDLRPGEFRQLEGRDMWVCVKSIGIKEDGEIKTKSHHYHNKSVIEGPEYNSNEWNVLEYLIAAAILCVFFAIILL